MQLKRATRPRTKEEIAERFEVSRATVFNLLKHYRDYGTLEHRLAGNVGRKPVFTPELDEQLRELVEQDQGITLERLRAELGLDCCLTTIWNRMIKLGLTHKKQLRAAEQDRVDVAEKRTRWKNRQRQGRRCFEPERLIFLDEIGLKTNMTRRYGWDHAVSVSSKQFRMGTGKQRH